MKRRMAKRVANIGVLAALAMCFSYIEALLPFSVGIPGVKLGIANIVVVIGLYLLPAGDVFLISLIRICLTGAMFGNGISLLYSLTGGLLSFFGMFFLKKFDKLSVLGVSMTGGVAHNIGQLAAAAFVLENSVVFGYLPVLMAAGIITGSLIGIASERIIRSVKKYIIYK